jgi:hypothetical protein
MALEIMKDPKFGFEVKAKDKYKLIATKKKLW